MAALGTLIRGDLPPAGNSIVWRQDKSGLPVFPGYRAIGVQSGTAALALALLAAKTQRPDIAHPEVVLPGYGCPDLVAAADYAGLHVRLADIGSDDPGYRLDALEASITSKTVAVVAVNFLGIRERFDQLRSLLAGREIALIEDDAQWFPEPLAAPALNGDLVSLSFGRGKPVSLLGGGSLYLREALWERLPLGWVDQQTHAANVVAPHVLRGKYALYNLMRRPFLYGLLSRNPLLKLGVTRYKSLSDISRLDDLRLHLLRPNISHQLSGNQSSEQMATTTLAVHADLLLDLPQVLRSRCGRLLRYPVLCRDSVDRDRLWRVLQGAGLGVTAMYQRHLPRVEGVSARFEAASLPGAERFAGRLLTLPLHAGVRADHWERLGSVLHSFAAR